MLMGLNLLEVLPLRFPSLDLDVRSWGLPPLALAYVAGLTFALAASPCSTPILATLLGFAATKNAPATGAALLFVYSLGYIAPLIAAASATVCSPTAAPAAGCCLQLLRPAACLFLAKLYCMWTQWWQIVRLRMSELRLQAVRLAPLPERGTVHGKALTRAYLLQEALKRVVSLRQYSGWLTPFAGVMLTAGADFPDLCACMNVSFWLAVGACMTMRRFMH